MGLLYNILQSLQENEAEAELSDRRAVKDEKETMEGPKSLIELLSQPIGSRSPDGKPK